VIPERPPLIELTRILKSFGEPRPLVIRELTIHASDRVALPDLNAGAAETLINLITGASLPDEGTVRVAGHDTCHISTDTDWLASLDRFGIVTARAVLIGALPVAANLALPLTLSIEPMSTETRAAVEALAGRVGLPIHRLDAKASTLTAGEQVRVHLARALAPRPELVLLEHPTAAIRDQGEQRALGEALRHATEATATGWVAMTSDRVFGRAAGATWLRIGEDGEVVREGFWSGLFR
jgi:predicted ABC-type transport system involved in lysophospholipase L1 biosynthesis ATPase subunit